MDYPVLTIKNIRKTTTAIASFVALLRSATSVVFANHNPGCAPLDKTIKGQAFRLRPQSDEKMKMKNIAKKTMISLITSAVLLGGVSAPAMACVYEGISVYGPRGGFTFYNGLLVQKDPQSGKKLTANQGVSVSSVAECAQVCLADANCTGVSYRPTSSKQCLTFAGYDFETNRHMELWIYSSAEYKYKSALIRSSYQGSVSN